MTGFLRARGPVKLGGRVLAAAFVMGALTASPAGAQYATACPPPQKLAAGACVAVCPAGYEDRGRTCVFRNQFN